MTPKHFHHLALTIHIGNFLVLFHSFFIPPLLKFSIAPIAVKVTALFFHVFSLFTKWTNQLSSPLLLRISAFILLCPAFVGIILKSLSISTRSLKEVADSTLSLSCCSICLCICLIPKSLIASSGISKTSAILPTCVEIILSSMGNADNSCCLSLILVSTSEAVSSSKLPLSASNVLLIALTSSTSLVSSSLIDTDSFHSSLFFPISPEIS